MRQAGLHLALIHPVTRHGQGIGILQLGSAHIPRLAIGFVSRPAMRELAHHLGFIEGQAARGWVWHDALSWLADQR